MSNTKPSLVEFSKRSGTLFKEFSTYFSSGDILASDVTVLRDDYFKRASDAIEWAEKLLPSQLSSASIWELSLATGLKCALDSPEKFAELSGVKVPLNVQKKFNDGSDLFDCVIGRTRDSLESYCEIEEETGSEFSTAAIQVGVLLGSQKDESSERIAFEEGPHNLKWHAAQILLLKGRLEEHLIDYISRVDANSIIETAGEYDDDANIKKGTKEYEQLVKQCAEDTWSNLDSAFGMGFLFRDAWWLEQHGEAATEYYKRMDGWKAQDEGRGLGAQVTKDKATAQREAVKELILKAVEKRGVAFAMATIQVKAETLRELADATCRMDFEFRAGELLTLKWFQERLEDLEATGELVALVEKGLDKA